MPYSRRRFVAAGVGAALAGTRRLSAAVAFPTRPANDRVLFPQPLDGARAAVNPPPFAWWKAQGAATYRLGVWNEAGTQVLDAPYLKDPVYLSSECLPPGHYAWNVEACDTVGDTVLARRGFWYFDVPEALPEFPWEEPAAILERVPGGHPRYVFLRDALPEIRATLTTTRKRAWDSVRSSAQRYLTTGLPGPPRYHLEPDPVRQRMGYTKYFACLRRFIDSAMSTLALAYVISGEERYGLAAKRILLEVESWGIEGAMSVSAPWGDEPGLSMAKHGHRAYDWLYDLFDSSERARVREMTAGRARQVLARLKRADYLAQPAESHNGRLIAYLSEYAVTLNEEAPDAAEWLGYSLKALTTFYPHWGDADGGWAEGVSYALSYNAIYLGALESLLAAAGYDLYRRPFFRSVRRFFLYCTSPIGEIKPFGDGTEGGVGSGATGLMNHHARRFQDPVSAWYAAQTGTSVGDPMLALVTEDNVERRPPADLPPAAVFRGIGWAAMHSALDDPRRDTFLLFKSSPFGSVSHSHADQNSFAILKGGAALAIPSGYYGPAYGMPHHNLWTRQTKANNSVLVNGAGQVVRSASAAGRISAFRHQNAMTYACGDAAAAYGGTLKRFLRHVLFLRPGLVAMLDELEAAEPAEFQWLLHAFDAMETNEEDNTVVCSRKGATLSVKLACPAGMIFSQTDQFDTPYNEGNPPEYHENKANQWHFSARTAGKRTAVRIGALMVVRGAGEEFETGWLSHPGWAGLSLRDGGGEGALWVRLEAGAAPPAGAGDGNILSGTWNSEEGREVFSI